MSLYSCRLLLIVHAMKILYITTPGKKAAVTIAETLLQEELIACANILENSTSIYKWEKEVKYEKEAVLILKVKDSKAQATITRAQAIHPYECPCIIQIPVENGNEDFLQWVEGKV